jgi:hypothetical protein
VPGIKSGEGRDVHYRAITRGAYSPQFNMDKSVWFSCHHAKHCSVTTSGLQGLMLPHRRHTPSLKRKQRMLFPPHSASLLHQSTLWVLFAAGLVATRFPVQILGIQVSDKEFPKSPIFGSSSPSSGCAEFPGFLGILACLGLVPILEFLRRRERQIDLQHIVVSSLDTYASKRE